MPVLVTAADTSLGTALVGRLLATGGEVRAYCSAGGQLSALRGAGAITASGDLDDEGRIEAACEQVHTVIHLAGGLLSPSGERIVNDTASVARAASSAGVQRLVMLSVVGASTSAPDAFRRAKATAEQVVAESTVPSVVLRTGLLMDGMLREILSGTPLPPQALDHAASTVSMRSLVEVLWMLDEMRSSATSGHAVLVAPGATQSLRGVVDEAEATIGTYRPLDTMPLLLDGLLGLWHDDDPIAADAWALTGIDPAVVQA